ncbi:MAG: hypothetical protein H8E98_06040 [Bacteroidetes bacterium]|nr:hypothetical protein [Bacteroidota bacterium]
MKKTELRQIIREEIHKLYEAYDPDVKELALISNRISVVYPIGLNSKLMSRVKKYYPEDYKTWYEYWKSIDNFIVKSGKSKMNRMSSKWWNDGRIHGRKEK